MYHPSDGNRTLWEEVSQKKLRPTSPLPFVGVHKVHQVQILKGICISNTPFGPGIYIDKKRVGSNPRPPLLDEPMAVEDLLGRGKLPRTIAERIERHGVGIGRTGRRHSCCEEGEMIGWERRVVIGEG
jgi:hypothetical protein